MNKPLPYILLLAIAIIASACSEKPRDPAHVDALPPIWPDYIGVTVPQSIAPLDFNVTGAQAMYATISDSKGSKMVGYGKHANFDIDQWHHMLSENVGDSIMVGVCAKIDSKWLQYKTFSIYISSYPLDQWGLTYRRIAPGYEVYSKMGLYQRDLSNFDECPIIENTQTNGQCYNCHAPNRTNPDQFVFHVRGDHGATMIQQGGKRECLKAINDSLGGAMVYPYWHPSGKYIAFSTNSTRQAFHIAGDKRLEVFDNASDVLVYDIERHEILLDTLLSQKAWSENAPAFSPDGKSLYFTTCLQKSYPLEYKDEQYNLCRIDFDPATGKFGEKVDTLFDAVAMGKSVTWPRPSYDGKFILFTLMDYGYFSIWHSEADQWLLDLATGEARPLDEINSDDADSYHNWSANSHWIVFTSRRGDGLYTRLYMAEVDNQGRMGKPFLLPQRNPAAYYGESLYSFNTPDFTSSKVDFDSNSAVDEILSPQRIATKIR